MRPRPQTLQVRDFIQDSLYHPEEGYFSARAAPVGALPAPIDFAALPGRGAYLRHVAALYGDLQAAWLTPAEIFQPHYGRAVAEHLLAAHTQRWGGGSGGSGGGGVPLRIFEVGGGTGTLARDVLGWLRDAHPAAYATASYTCLEISATLAALQQEKVEGCGGGGHGGRFSVLRRDATQRGAWGPRSLEPCSVVMMEVLDNLPHDRAWRAGPGAPWQETLVAGPPAGAGGGRGDGEGPSGGGQAGGRWEEVVRPAADPLVRRCLAALEEQEAEEGGRQALGARLVAAADRLLRGGEAQLAAAGVGPSVCLLSNRLRRRQHQHHLVISSILCMHRHAGEAGEAAFLPTGALQLMDALHAARPNHHLLAGDFDALPETRVPGRGAPLVATTVSSGGGLGGALVWGPSAGRQQRVRPILQYCHHQECCRAADWG